MKSEYERKYFNLLKEQYPTKDCAVSEILTLNASLNLPKGTEHFISDLHGEHEALAHILRSASGVIRRKLVRLFGDELSTEEISELSSFIYYPEQKLAQRSPPDRDEWACNMLPRLVPVLKTVCEKYPKRKVREVIFRVCREYGEIIYELISVHDDNGRKMRDKVYESARIIGCGGAIATALCHAIRALAVDRLHVVGDLFDRGPRADLVLEELMEIDSIDIQWGNHDALWIGAALGSEVCIATAVANSLAYGNTECLELGYGISLRGLSSFAEEAYEGDVACSFAPRGGRARLGDGESVRIARMYKAISVIQMKLECQVISRNPDFMMEDRRLMESVDFERGEVVVDGKRFTLRDGLLPTVDKDSPSRLSAGEKDVMRGLWEAFLTSEKLRRHIKFIVEVGGTYKIYNENLLFHGSVPLCENGDFMRVKAASGLYGRALMDECDRRTREAFYAPTDSDARRSGCDFLWFLWCGRGSPMCGKDAVRSFERIFVEDEAAHTEKENAYYRSWESEEIALKILREFSLGGPRSHIINGHIPIKRGESPIKARGRIIVIDGGFCSAYHERTGIAGYTLIYNREGMRISAHAPFVGRERAIRENLDILSETIVFELSVDEIRQRECDEGEKIREKITELITLLREYYE